MKITAIAGKLVIALLLVVTGLTAPSYAATGKRQPAAHPTTRHVDLRAKINRMKWKEGNTTIYSNRDIKLVAEVRDGKVVSVTPIDIGGRIRSVNQQSGSGGAGGKGTRPCIFCYNLDQPLGSTCIEVPCWILPLLKWLQRI
jgi:hypothetical protein